MADVVIAVLFVLWVATVVAVIVGRRLNCFLGRHVPYRPTWYRCACCYYCGVDLPNRKAER